jgi:hypothetical protein
MVKQMITTVDNPFNPFTEIDAWTEWDEASGYYTSGLLARIINTSDALSEADQEVAYRDAIQEIVRENVSGVHRLVDAPS